MKVTFEKNQRGQDVKVQWEPTGSRFNVGPERWEEILEGTGLDGSRWVGNALFIKDETTLGTIMGDIHDKEEVPMNV